jgi:hypothetical protein
MAMLEALGRRNGCCLDKLHIARRRVLSRIKDLRRSLGG